MKKIVIGITIVICLLTACSHNLGSEPTPFVNVNNLDSVTMITKPETVTRTGLTVIIENHSSERWMYGQYFSVEKKSGDNWYEVPILEDAYSFIDLGHNVAPLQSVEWVVDWEGYYGVLDKGEYRILKDFRNSEETDDEIYHLAAEFIVQ